MTATERLRALLDERGVEWEGSKAPMPITSWHGGHGFKFTAMMPYGTTDYITDYLLVQTNTFDEWPHLTPDQAVEATLGRGTCRYEPDYMGFTWWDENDVEHYEEHSASDECWSASCDKCGHAMIVGDEGWFKGWDDVKAWTEEDGSEHQGILLEPIFNYCPNCGRRVVNEQ